MEAETENSPPGSGGLCLVAAAREHLEGIWEIFREVVRTGDTYTFDPAISREAALAYWMAEGTHAYAALLDGRVVGTYTVKANHTGLGSHVANASYMVSPQCRGRGVGSVMCAHSLEEARRLGFQAMQFNIVVSTNAAAVSLWKKHGFSIVGMVPKAFRHQVLGLVDTYVMHRFL